jgi:hypothetical protein
MRRTPTTVDKAEKSANARLTANQDALHAAYAQDVKEGPAGGLRHQYRAAAAWLRSEATALGGEDRQNVLNHLIQLCQKANAQARQTVHQHRD